MMPDAYGLGACQEEDAKLRKQEERRRKQAEAKQRSDERLRRMQDEADRMHPAVVAGQEVARGVSQWFAAGIIVMLGMCIILAVVALTITLIAAGRV